MDPTRAALITGITGLLGVLIGGVLTLLGTIWVARDQAKREAKQQQRDNLYRLQETLEEAFRHYDAAMKAPPTVAPHPDLTSVDIRLRMLLSRVDDQSLDTAVSAILEKLAEARDAEGSYPKEEAFKAALRLLEPVRQRIAKLLRTDAKVDLGV